MAATTVFRNAAWLYQRSMREVPKLDWAQRTTDELAPMVLPRG